MAEDEPDSRERIAVKNVRAVRDNSAPAINAALTDNLAGVVRWSPVVRLVAPSIAETAFVVRHSLGVVPDRYIAMPVGKGYVWHTTDDQKSWDNQHIVLRCSTASTQIDVSVGTL